MLTQEIYEARILGYKDLLHAPTNVLVALTGNKVVAVGDMATRLLPVSLVPNCENPEQRSFTRRNIEAWVDDHRLDCARAVNIILLAWAGEGRAAFDSAAHKPSRFQEWDDAVRFPLMWLGQDDMLELFARNQYNDPETDGKVELLRCWHEVHGSARITAKELASSSHIRGNEELRAALTNLLASEPTDYRGLRELGYVLRNLHNVVAGGNQLRQKDKSAKSKKSVQWYVVQMRRV